MILITSLHTGGYKNGRISGNELATVPISALCFELLNLVSRLRAKVRIKILENFYYG